MEVLASRTHLVEIDLIRAGEPMPITGNGSASDYRILVSRGDCRPNASLYALESATDSALLVAAEARRPGAHRKHGQDPP